MSPLCAVCVIISGIIDDTTVRRIYLEPLSEVTDTMDGADPYVMFYQRVNNGGTDL
jgi:hypothetical protein